MEIKDANSVFSIQKIKRRLSAAILNKKTAIIILAILIGAADRWFAERNINQISVVVQGRNVKAQRLYQKNNFLTSSVELWYHLWFN